MCLSYNKALYTLIKNFNEIALAKFLCKFDISSSVKKKHFNNYDIKKKTEKRKMKNFLFFSYHFLWSLARRVLFIFHVFFFYLCERKCRIFFVLFLFFLQKCKFEFSIVLTLSCKSLCSFVRYALG